MPSRAVDHELLEAVNGDERLIVVTGTAGTGKSTSIMRAALAVSAQGTRVMRLNHEAHLRAHRIRRAVDADKPDVLLIDDLDRLGAAAVGVLQDVTRGGAEA